MNMSDYTMATEQPDRSAEYLVTRTRRYLEYALARRGQREMPETPEFVGQARAWDWLVRLFRLNQAEADLLATALAVAIQPSLGPELADAQGEQTRLLPSEPLIKEMFGHDAPPIYKATSPLAMWRLVRPVAVAPGAPDMYRADPVLVNCSGVIIFMF